MIEFFLEIMTIALVSLSVSGIYKKMQTNMAFLIISRLILLGLILSLLFLSGDIQHYRLIVTIAIILWLIYDTVLKFKSSRKKV
jgi:chromate transport protein ChrA